LPLERGDDERDILSATDFERDEVQTERANGRLDLAHFQLNGWIIDIAHDRHCRTNSLAISAKRSARPSAQRNSMSTLRPSIHPSWCSRCTH
jgi:hypothetical protein